MVTLKEIDGTSGGRGEKNAHYLEEGTRIKNNIKNDGDGLGNPTILVERIYIRVYIDIRFSVVFYF